MHRRIPDTLRAAAVLAIVIILVYGEVSFLGYTLSPAVRNLGVMNGFQYGYEGREPYTFYVMDPLATGGQNWPIYAIISRALISGQAPLWNPYQGTGAPLAADTSWDAYYPVNILYAIPNQYWDFVWFLKLWLAGILCYLFLKDLQLDFMPSLGGSFVYCLSGALIFSPFMHWSDVAILTPALLLAAKRCFDRPLSANSLSMGSILVSVSILGAHIESLVIQFLFVALFVLFQAIAIRRKDRVRGLVTWMGTVSIGFGLAAFFLLPVFEYLSLATLGHVGDVGVLSLSDGSPAAWLLTLFVPYFFGPLQTYPYQGLRQLFVWDMSPGYLGTSVFFLASVALFSLRDLKRSERRYDPRYVIFFLTAGFLILLKIFGVPPVNWIGYLPVLSHVIFPRYSGSVLAASFSGACAFGLQSIFDRSSSTKSLRNALLLPFLTITFAALLCVPILAFVPVPILHWLPFPLFLGSFAYLILSLTFLLLAYVVAVSRTIHAVKALVILVILELVSYVPMSLPLGYEAARVGICATAAIIVALYARGSAVHLFPAATRLMPAPKAISKEHVFGLVLLAALLLQSGVAGVSPMGLPTRYDVFTEAPYLSFLKANIGYQRAYSLDGVLFPPVAGVFAIQHLGEFSAFMPHPFREFSLLNLDSGAPASTLVGNAWFRQQGPSASSEIRRNIEFYSLLGVKYFVTAYTDLSLVEVASIEIDQPWYESPFVTVGNNVVSTGFVTDRTFDTILMPMTTLGQGSTGTVRLVLDSVPYNESLHREAQIQADSVTNRAALRAPGKFTFARLGIVQTTEFNITLTQSDPRTGNEVVIYPSSQARQDPHLRASGSYRVNNDTQIGYLALSLALHQDFLPVVYRDQDVTIYENSKAFLRAFLVGNFVVVRNETEAVRKTHELGWNTRNMLVIEEEPSAEELALIHTANVNGTLGTVRVERYSAEDVEVSTDNSSSFLVMTDIYYPGWRCYVDGKPVEIHRAYGAVRAVFLEQGPHRVVFRYEPDSFRIGLAISLLSVGGVLFLIARNAVMRPHTMRRGENRKPRALLSTAVERA
jgi:hypothetical protein